MINHDITRVVTSLYKEDQLVMCDLKHNYTIMLQKQNISRSAYNVAHINVHNELFDFAQKLHAN